MIIIITPLPFRLILFIIQELTMHPPVTKTFTMTTLFLNHILLILDVWLGPLWFALESIFTFTIFPTLHFFHCVDFRYSASLLLAIYARHSSITSFKVTVCPFSLLFSTLFMATCRTETRPFLHAHIEHSLRSQTQQYLEGHYT
uniref:Uncharacterized protein n=1 Tax=Meloidogyne incognita TaxID=6306 RepID=A0A914NNB5_MELIC